MLTQEEYEELGKHLNKIDIKMNLFAGEHGYNLYDKTSGGRYPNRRITRIDTAHRSILITMDTKENGDRFSEFFPDIPYSIYGAAWIDNYDACIRWHCPKLTIDRLPFSELFSNIDFHLSHFHSYLMSISDDYIIRCNQKSQLPKILKEHRACPTV